MLIYPWWWWWWWWMQKNATFTSINVCENSGDSIYRVNISIIQIPDTAILSIELHYTRSWIAFNSTRKTRRRRNRRMKINHNSWRSLNNNKYQSNANQSCLQQSTKVVQWTKSSAQHRRKERKREWKKQKQHTTNALANKPRARERVREQNS